MVVAVKKLGYGDFLKSPDDGNRHEVLDGEWRMTPPPSQDHQAVAAALFGILLEHASSRKLGRVRFAPVGVILGRHTVVQPDILFVSERRRSILRSDAVHGAPDLVIEVLSPATADYDRREKAEIYERSGVREYWLVDLFARAVEIREFGRRGRMRIVQTGQSFDSALLPGLAVRVSDLFRELGSRRS